MTDALMYTDTNGDAHVVGVMSDNAKDIKYKNTNVEAALDSLTEGNIPTLETKIDNTFRTATSNNLIPMPYKDAHGTRNGITYDQIDNAGRGELPGYGSYKINGTSSAYTELELTQTDIYLIPGTYRFQGGIGGSSSTYYLQIEVYNSRQAIDKFKNYSTLGKDWTTFTLTEKSRIKAKVIINSGVTVSNVPLFPILERVPDITDNMINVDSLLSQVNPSTSETDYNCNWQNYNYLSFQVGSFDNVENQIIVPYSFFSTTYNGMRVILHFSRLNVFYEIWQKGSGKVRIKASASSNGTTVKIYGMFKK